MLMEVVLDATLSPHGHLLLPRFCYHVEFPRGPLSVTDPPPTQNSEMCSNAQVVLFLTVHRGMLMFPCSQWKHSGR